MSWASWTVVAVAIACSVMVSVALYYNNRDVSESQLEEQFRLGIESGQETMRRELLVSSRKYGKRYEVQVWDWINQTIGPAERFRWVVWDADRLLDDSLEFDPTRLLMNNTPVAMGNSASPLAAYVDALTALGMSGQLVTPSPATPLMP